jgi:hypothetical protein
VEPIAEVRNLLSPPTWLKVLLVNGRNAPVACSEADQVLPMLTTSGPWPEVVAARMRFSRSAHPITWRWTVMPVCCLNVASSGFRTL